MEFRLPCLALPALPATSIAAEEPAKLPAQLDKILLERGMHSDACDIMVERTTTLAGVTNVANVPLSAPGPRPAHSDLGITRAAGEFDTRYDTASIFGICLAGFGQMTGTGAWHFE